MNGGEGVFVIVWEFEARAGKEPEFEQAYSAQGEWAKLFARSPEYRGTELLQSAERNYYLTIDRWTSAEAFAAFRERWAAEYEALDRACKALTQRETAIGRFETR